MEKVLSQKKSIFRFFLEKVLNTYANGLVKELTQISLYIRNYVEHKMMLVVSYCGLAWKRFFPSVKFGFYDLVPFPCQHLNY